MRITIVQPQITVSNLKRTPFIQPPLGPAYLAASLREAGHEVTLVDGLGEGIGQFTPFRNEIYLHGLTNREIIGRIDPDSGLIGVSIMFSDHWPHAKDLIADIRSAFPAIPIVAGGEHVSALPRLTLRDPNIDYIVTGEGEETIIELCEVLESGGDVASVSGAGHVGDDGEMRMAPPRKRNRTIDQIPWPAWDMVPIGRYIDTALYNGMTTDRKSMVILGTRGCPYTCKFCSNETMWGTSYFTRNVKDLVDEMECYIERYGTTDFHFQDLTFVVNRRWTIALCQEVIDRGLDITFKLTSGTRSEALDEEVLTMLSRAGLKELFLAPESGSERILDIIRKKVDLEHVLEVARTVRRLGIDTDVTAITIIGYPEERIGDVLQTYRLILKLMWAGVDTIFINKFVAYPGCEYHDIMVREGKIVHDEEYFSRLERNFNFFTAGVSWHPRWSGRQTFMLITLGYLIFFGSYYATRPLKFVSFIRRILGNRPQTRFERYFAYRLYQPLGSRKSDSVTAAESVSAAAGAPESGT